MAYSAGYAIGKAVQVQESPAPAATPFTIDTTPREGVCALIFDQVGDMLDEERMQDELRIQEFQSQIPGDLTR